MNTEVLKTARTLQESIEFNKKVLASLNRTGFWNVSLTMDGSVTVYVPGEGNYEISSFEDLALDFITKMKSRVEYKIRKDKLKMKAL